MFVKSNIVVKLLDCMLALLVSDTQPLTKSTLIEALDEAGFVKKDDINDLEKSLKGYVNSTSNDLEKSLKGYVNSTVREASDAILKGMDVMFTSQSKKIDNLEIKIDDVETRLLTEIHHVKDEVRGLKADLSMKADRQELAELRKKIAAEQTN